MSATHFDADDAREDRARELREQRARMRNGGAVPAESVEEALTPPAPTRAPAIVPASQPRETGRLITVTTAKPSCGRPPAPKPTPPKSAPELATAASRRAFEPVDDLPWAMNRARVPAARLEMIDWCIANRDRWVRYNPTRGQDKVKAGTIYSHTKAGTGGFEPVAGGRWECTVRNDVAFVCFASGGDS